MPRIFIHALAAAAMLAVPSVATAQNRGDLRDAREDYREERREYRDALRYGDRRDVREERREYRDAARDLERERYQAGKERRWNDYRHYQRYNGRAYPYQGSYYYRDGRYHPGAGQYYYRDGRYYRYTNNRGGWYGPNGRAYNDYYQCRRDNNLAGTAIGAVTGGLLGNTLAGRGDKAEGAVIGALLGGVLGNRIDAADNRRRCY